MNKLRGKNVTFFMEDELDEYSINLTTWNAANGLFCETADELAVDFKDRIVLAIKNRGMGVLHPCSCFLHLILI